MAIPGDATHLLHGLLVVEVGTRRAAGACGSLMADNGADVVLVEDDARPREARAMAAAGKRSIRIDSRRDEDRALLLRLVDIADAVLLCSDSGDLETDIWNRQRPTRQILCDLTAYGHSGPLQGTNHSEAQVQAMTAVADTTGRPDGRPHFVGASLLDMEAAVYAMAAISAAALVRRRTGTGQRIDIALYDVAVNALLTFIPLVLTGRPATRAGNRHPALAPWNAFRTTDGWVLICGPTNDQWRKLCALMEQPDLCEAEPFRTPAARVDNVDLLETHVSAWVSRLTTERCLDLVGGQGIPCSSIVALADLMTEANIRHRRMILQQPDPVLGTTIDVPGNPLRILGVDPVAAKPIPVPDSGREWCLQLIDTRPRDPDRTAGDPPLPGRPLDGIRVVEIGMNTVAPLACRQLGALGADVIKVEPPTGDTNRLNAPLRADGLAYVYALSNTDKRGIVLDLRTEADRATLWRLLETADVVIENLKPGSLGKLGFGAEAVRRRFPSIIYCSVNGFGYDSVYPGRPALDTVIQAMSGVMSATPVAGVPTKSGISISDQLGGQFALAGILAALYARGAEGKGLAFDIAMQDCSTWATQALWNNAALALPEVVGTPSGFQATADGGRTFTPILSVAQVMAHPQTEARALLKTVPTADGDSWVVLGSPMRLLSTPAEVRSAMPRLGFVHPDLAEELTLAPAGADVAVNG